LTVLNVPHSLVYLLPLVDFFPPNIHPRGVPCNTSPLTFQHDVVPVAGLRLFCWVFTPMAFCWSLLRTFFSPSLSPEVRVGPDLSVSFRKCLHPFPSAWGTPGVSSTVTPPVGLARSYPVPPCQRPIYFAPFPLFLLPQPFPPCFFLFGREAWSPFLIGGPGSLFPGRPSCSVRHLFQPCLGPAT